MPRIFSRISRLFFAQDKNDKKGMLLHDKTERIFSCMHHLFPGNVGFFMVVLDNGDRHRLVYDRDAQSYAILKNRFEQDTIKKAFKEAFLPYDQCVSTIWLLRRETGGQWKDSEENICFDFGPIGDATTLCLVRIGDIEKDKHPVGILGVYSKDRDTISERSMKLLLSLRQVLYEFVHLHHRNNEFVDLWLTEAQARFAYLAGHGRVLMQALSREDDSFGPVVSTMEHLQYVLNIVREKDRRKELINHTFHQSEFDGNRALSLVETVYEYAKKIYASDYAEMQVACKFGQIPHSVEDGGKKVSFSMDILRAICFELVINAKKNRFHFVDDCYRKATSYQSNSLPVNTFSTSVVFEKTYVCIDVSATGSRVPDNRKRIIETGQANKPDEEVSGIDLIYSLITVFNKKNRIMIESERVEDLPLVYLNTVSIRLYYD